MLFIQFMVPNIILSTVTLQKMIEIGQEQKNYNSNNEEQTRIRLTENFGSRRFSVDTSSSFTASHLLF
jgi:hypothetical protein